MSPIDRGTESDEHTAAANVLWPLWDDQRQTWHDKVINTYVIKMSV